MRWTITSVATLLLLALPGCGGNGKAAGDNEISGSVVMAAVSGATVEAFAALDTGAVDPTPLGTGTTAADGSFTVGVGAYSGPVVLVATGGSYVDEATGSVKTIASDEPVLGMAMAAGGTVAGNITPLTHWAATVAHALAADPNTGAELAMSNAVKMVEDYFGVTGLLTTVPADLTSGTVPPGNAAEHAAAIAGLSQLADDEGYTDPIQMINDIAVDGSDGLFDGDARGVTTLPSSDMGGQRLADAIRDFLDNNARNQSGLGQGSVAVDETIEGHASSGSSSYLWPPRVDSMDVAGGTTAGSTTVSFSGEFLDTSSGVDVSFDTGTAGIVSSGPTSVVVTTPAHAAGRVDIEIVNGKIGLMTRLENAFEYFTPGAPAITRICPDYGPTTGGSLIEIYGSRLQATSTVEVDGMVAQVVQRAVPGLLVARAPPHALGIVQVVVRNGSVASNPASFEYRDRNVGHNLADADYAGNWTLYRLGHEYNGTSSCYAARTSLNFNGTGAISYSETRRTTSPGNTAGTQATTSGTYDYAAFPDGTLHIDFNPSADPENREFLRAWTQDEGDVFAGGRIERPFVTELAVGVRNGSGMTNGSLIGKYWLAGFSTQHFSGAGDRYTATLFGYAEFDGAGSGSFTALITYRETGDDDYYRTLDSFAFTYSVASNGNFTLTWEDGTILHGTVAQAGDFAAVAEYDSPAPFEGELAIFLLTKQGNRLMPSSLAGSWYGGAFSQEFGGAGNSEHFYMADRFRSLTDTQGLTLFEFATLDTSDTDPEGEAEEELDAGQVFVSPSGVAVVDSSPLGLIGAVGGSRRFLLTVPTWPMGDTGDQVDQLCGLLLRNCAFYSQGSLDQQYNTATLSHVWGSPQDPPVADEEASNWVGEMVFTPTVPALLEGMPFLASGTAFSAGGQRKIWKKTPGTAGDTDLVTEPDFNGGYALAGDGRTYVFQASGGPVTAVAQVDDAIDVLVGQTAPHGEAAMLRTPFSDGTFTYLTALTRAPTGGATSPTGDYFLCDFSIGVDGLQTTTRTTRGTVTLDPVGGSFNGTIDSHQRWEDGRPDVNASNPVTGTLSVAADGTVTLTPTGATPLGGIVTPDGSALFIVDDSPNSLFVSFALLVRKNALGTGVNTAGAFSVLSFEHEFPNPGLYPPAAEAELGQGETTVRTNGVADAGSLGGYRNNLEGLSRLEGDFSPGAGWATAGDGALTFTVPGTPPEIIRGAVSDNGRYGCMIPGDLAPNDTMHFLFMRR